MEITGKITYVLPERSGTSARGEWKAQSFVVETKDQYPRKMVFDVFGAERLQRFNIKSGDEVTVFFDIDAHEYQGRWFNNIRAYDVAHLDAAAAQAAGRCGPTDDTGGTGSVPSRSARCCRRVDRRPALLSIFRRENPTRYSRRRKHAHDEHTTTKTGATL